MFTVTLANRDAQRFEVDGEQVLLAALEDQGVSLP
jgi:hypothetical protein